MGRETGTLQLLTPLLLTGGKGADLVIRGNVVLNTRDMWASMVTSTVYSSSVFSAGHTGVVASPEELRQADDSRSLENHALR
jgi:hypothetical protein